MHKRRCRRVAAKLLFGIGRPAFVGALVTISLRFFFLIFQRRPLFRRKVGKFGVTIEFQFDDIVVTFFDEKNLKMRTGPLGVSI